ncbi:MAG: hypothetical protein ACFFB3_08205 [Candidatus Hodarchaeota archaeon]
MRKRSIIVCFLYVSAISVILGPFPKGLNTAEKILLAFVIFLVGWTYINLGLGEISVNLNSCAKQKELELSMQDKRQKLIIERRSNE